MRLVERRAWRFRARIRRAGPKFVCVGDVVGKSPVIVDPAIPVEKPTAPRTYQTLVSVFQPRSVMDISIFLESFLSGKIEIAGALMIGVV